MVVPTPLESTAGASADGSSSTLGTPGPMHRQEAVSRATGAGQMVTPRPHAAAGSEPRIGGDSRGAEGRGGEGEVRTPRKMAGYRPHLRYLVEHGEGDIMEAYPPTVDMKQAHMICVTYVTT